MESAAISKLIALFGAVLSVSQFVGARRRLHPLAPTASRPNKRIRLWEIESQNSTVRALERAYEQSLAEVDKLAAYRADIAKSEELTDPGKAKAITKAALQSTAQLKAARNAVDKARDQAAELRKTVTLPKPDPTDHVAFLRRQEIRAHLARMDHKTRHEFVNKHASCNPDVGMAILEMPPEFTNVRGTDLEELVEQTLEAAHGEKLLELREIEHAIEVANSAAETAWENQAHEVGVYDLKEWEKQAADIQAAEYIPWLRKSGSEVRASPLEGRLIGRGHGAPLATEEEIAKGRFFANKQEWAAANGIKLNDDIAA